MEIWAHRGRTSSKQFGNSHLNFLNASRLEITGFEADICLTRDQKIIIYHPGSTRPDLSQMQSQDMVNSIFGMGVMDLDFFLNFLKTSGMYCCLDIKQYSPKLVRESVKGITEHGLEDKIYLTAFQKQMNYPPFNIESDGRLLLMAKKMNPYIKTHVISIWPFNLLNIADKYRPDAISFGWLNEPPIMSLASRAIFKTLSSTVNLSRQIEAVKFKGIKVWAGIFNHPKEMLYFIQLGVDGIMTDEPKILLDLIKNQKIPT